MALPPIPAKKNGYPEAGTFSPRVVVLGGKQHKMFLTRCEMGEPRQVTAAECEKCPHGKVLNNRTVVICAGSMKFFVTPCFFDARASATVRDCEECEWGEIGEDRLRVLCGRI
ncbi:MAG: hypothetical protein QXJ32_08055 [Thermoplasmata archaeon]